MGLVGAQRRLAFLMIVVRGWLGCRWPARAACLQTGAVLYLFAATFAGDLLGTFARFDGPSSAVVVMLLLPLQIALRGVTPRESMPRTVRTVCGGTE